MNNVESMLQCKKWAVVGATDNCEKFGYKIYKALKGAGYNVYPVNPGVDDILGDKCYPTLKDLPIKPEVVNVVVPPRVGEQIMKECAQIGITNVWLQPGANAESVVNTAKELGLSVVDQNCILVELRK
ncbi:MAG TPA: CoA-binding protein [Methylomusa anaerophila]|uniref:CoA binding domain protein n=1 Tax=Methylomusa anaerophila TaxID=1930071 RepID=A0A348AQD0_9FIRM|nr:CoA-binding protein [Methylomusa anaerophila]BBB93278.1 CoA binding domain protein [Methylomusa anaerophila]HML86891.1 CoA-binding protein [Methylomusa anaerophila]